jgi:peptidylamidoglycolate lyase
VAEGPIAVPTVLTLDPHTGAVLSDWGRSFFYMPHGVTIDADDDVWLTDVALHQVFKVRVPGSASQQIPCVLIQSKGSLPRSQNPATGAYPQPLHILPNCFFKIHFNIILTSATKSST